MELAEVVEFLAGQLQKNLKMLPVTSKMAANRYVRVFCEERSKERLDNSDMREFGRWLTKEFAKTGLVKGDALEKIQSEFQLEFTRGTEMEEHEETEDRYRALRKPSPASA